MRIIEKLRIYLIRENGQSFSVQRETLNKIVADFEVSETMRKALDVRLHQANSNLQDALNTVKRMENTIAALNHDNQKLNHTVIDIQRDRQFMIDNLKLNQGMGENKTKAFLSEIKKLKDEVSDLKKRNTHGFIGVSQNYKITSMNGVNSYRDSRHEAENFARCQGGAKITALFSMEEIILSSPAKKPIPSPITLPEGISGESIAVEGIAIKYGNLIIAKLGKNGE